MNNILLLATEVILIMLMATGIYSHNAGRRAFKIMFREVWDPRCLGAELICSCMFILGSLLAHCRSGGADCASGKKYNIYAESSIGVKFLSRFSSF